MSKISSDEQLKRFASLFFNRNDCYYQQQDDGSWRFKQGRLTLNHIQQHINGDITLGAPTISQDELCRYVVWDSDYNFGSLIILQTFLNKVGFVTYRESISLERQREGHLWLFIQPAIESVVAYSFVKTMTLAAGLRLDPGSKIIGSIEAFPKSSSASSNIRVPLGINRKSGERGYWAHLPKDMEQQLAFVPVFNSKEQIYIHTELRGKLLDAMKPEPRTTHKTNDHILSIIPEWWLADARQYGDKLIMRCSYCRESQHDQKRGSMHLCVYSDGRFGCIKGCSGRNIWQAFKRLMNVRNVA
jgi:hypothetical protein